MIRSYLFKLVRSKGFCAGIILIVIICAEVPVHQYIETGFQFIDPVAASIETLTSSYDFGIIIAVLGAVPFAANFADEWKSGVTKSIICRSGVKKYAVSNVLICSLSSFITITIGMMLFAAVLNVFALPLELDEYDIGHYMGNPYGIIMAAGHPYLFMLARVAVFAAANSVAVAAGMTLSSFFPDKYIAVCSPLIFMTLIQLTASKNAALFNFTFSYLMRAWFPRFGNPFLELLFSFSYFAVYIVILGAVFVKTVERRVQGENY